MYPTIMNPETRRDLIIAHVSEGVASDWPAAYVARGVDAILAIANDADLLDFDVADENRDVPDTDLGDIDGLNDQQVVSLIISYHWG